MPPLIACCTLINVVATHAPPPPQDPNEVAPGGANTPAAVKHIIHGFGYATTQVPGSTAQKVGVG